MYNLKESYLGEAAAMSIVNFGLIIVIVCCDRGPPGQPDGRPPRARRPGCAVGRAPPRLPRSPLRTALVAAAAYLIAASSCCPTWK